MEIHFTPEQEAQLAEIAVCEGTTAEKLMQAKAIRILDASTRFLAAVQKGVEAADRGELSDHQEVVARMEEWFAAE